VIPYVVIGIAAVIGLFGWGVSGLILGAFAGYVLNMVLGLVFGLLSGGLLPRKVRRDTASTFIASHADEARRAFREASQLELQRLVEQRIERIFKRAAMDNKSMDLQAGLDRRAVAVAAAAVVTDEHNPEVKTLLIALAGHIDTHMYS
jgi:hypothetical protein